MKNTKQFLTFLIVAFVFCGLLFAQETTQEKKTNKEVISAQSLSKVTNAEDMAEALKSIPGVYVRSGQINIRDATANKILILIDGQRMNNAQSGGYDVTTLPIDAIETVEVLRGGNSARYGSDAVGGVVNFITKKAKETSKMDLGLRATYGSFNSQFYNVYTSNTLDDFNYYLSYKRRQSDGDYKYLLLDGTEKTRENNYSKGDDFLVKLGYKLPANSNLLFTGQLGQSENGSPGSVKGLKNFATITPRALLRTNNSYFNLSYNIPEVFGKANLNANSYYQYFRTRFDDPDSWGGPTKSDHKVNAYGVELTQNNPVIENLLNLTYGYAYRHDNANSTSIGDKDRSTHSGHLSANFGFKNVGFYFDNISIVPAVRYDAPSDFDKVFSPKISFMVSSTDAYALNISTHWSKSYRAPTFNDLWWPEDAYTVGNPNLKPEYGTTIEAGYGVTLPFINTQIRMNYFVSEMTDQIIWAPRADFKWMPTNVEKSKTSGLETYIGTKVFDNKLKLELNHTYMDARDKSGKANDGKLLIYRPFHKVDFNTALVIDIYEININYQFLSQRYVDVKNTAALSDVSRWNMNVGVNPILFDLKWMLRLDLNNVFNKSYRLSDGYPMPGREVRMTVGLSLQ
ncbi:MAG: TonB-dependent receptor [Melioribacteraceae bacterium]